MIEVILGVVGVDICSCLCWFAVLFLGICCPIWILGKCGGSDFLDREFLLVSEWVGI